MCGAEDRGYRRAVRGAGSGVRDCQVGRPDAGNTVHSQAQVTGYVSSLPYSPAQPSGPIPVMVHGAPAASPYQIIKGLRGSSGDNCTDNAQLYQILTPP
jgi:hypothetical protein